MKKFYLLVFIHTFTTISYSSETVALLHTFKKNPPLLFDKLTKRLQPPQAQKLLGTLNHTLQNVIVHGIISKSTMCNYDSDHSSDDDDMRTIKSTRGVGIPIRVHSMHSIINKFDLPTREFLYTICGFAQELLKDPQATYPFFVSRVPDSLKRTHADAEPPAKRARHTAANQTS